MKKILFIVDYLHNEPNSVSEILRKLLAIENETVEKIVANQQGNQSISYTVQEIDGIKSYSAKTYSNCSLTMMRVRSKLFGCKDQIQCNIEHIRNIIEIECPDLVFFFLYSPEKNYVEICENMSIPYIFMLYDTYIGRPEFNCNRQVAIDNEKPVIDKSVCYFVPSFFYNEYNSFYKTKKVVPYDLPLLVEINSVKKAFESRGNTYNFTYFGQVQDFRNSKTINTILKSLDISLDVFTQSPIESDETFLVHTPVNGDELYSKVAHSKFLIAFDNNYPYDWYLPSKAYLYVSFTKPIIAFGENDDSALLQFFKEYPCFYYQKINEDTDGLVDFINKCDSIKFDEHVYKQYERFLPNNALDYVDSVIKKILCI